MYGLAVDLDYVLVGSPPAVTRSRCPVSMQRWTLRLIAPRVAGCVYVTFTIRTRPLDLGCSTGYAVTLAGSTLPVRLLDVRVYANTTFRTLVPHAALPVARLFYERLVPFFVLLRCSCR